MPKKVLLCATVDVHFQAFHLPYMRWFQEQGWEVHVAAKGDMELPYVDRKFELPMQRSPLKLDNMEAYRQLKAIIDENQYELIHCHTPMGGVLARLAARGARKRGTKVIYTAHGFHFCKGAPFVNWLLYYPIEKVLARYTDCLITINEEDYTLAVKRRFRAKRIERVHGVGVYTDRFQPLEEHRKQETRASLGYTPNEFLMFYAAEFNKNKNQQMLLHALALIKDEVPHAKLLLAGDGPLQQDCRELARRLGIAEMVDFLGYRSDIERILPMCDASVASSLREGLPVNIMEAMASGLPVIATANRGHKELIADHKNGWIIAAGDPAAMADKMVLLARDDRIRLRLGLVGRDLIQRAYTIHKVLEEKRCIYSELMDDKVDVVRAVP